jgi:hypothetical protein
VEVVNPSFAVSEAEVEELSLDSMEMGNTPLVDSASRA